MTPFFVINEETGEIILKKSVAELGKVLTSNIFLLPVKATELVSAAENAISMSTTVQIAFVLLTAKNNLHQDFLNRSVSFILNDSAANVLKRKDDIEKGLTQITGGHVNVYEIHAAEARPGSVVHAWVLYPSDRATVDLRNIQKTAAAILGLEDEPAAPDSRPHDNGHKHSNNDSIHTASIIHHEYQTLIWVLIFFILLTIVFLLILCCIWFWCCRSPAHLKVWLDGGQQQAGRGTPASHTVVQELNDKTSLINQKGRRERGSEGEAASSMDSGDMRKGSTGYTNEGFRYHNKVKRIRPPRQSRARLKQGLSRSVTTMNTNDMVYPEDPDRRSSKMKSMESSFDDDYDDQESYRTEGTGSKTKGMRTEIMYIRSPPESFDENFRNLSENEIICLAPDAAQDGMSDENFMRRSSTKQVSFLMQRMSTPGHEGEACGSQELMKRKRSLSNDTIASADLQQGADSASESVPVTATARTRSNQTPASVSSSSSRSSAKIATTVSVPGTVEEAEQVAEPLSPNRLTQHKSLLRESLDPKLMDEDKSDSDSGIGRGSKSRQHGDLNIKNKSLMEKKNIFTLAYDGVRTQRIRSSESDRESL